MTVTAHTNQGGLGYIAAGVMWPAAVTLPVSVGFAPTPPQPWPQIAYGVVVIWGPHDALDRGSDWNPVARVPVRRTNSRIPEQTPPASTVLFLDELPDLDAICGPSATHL